MIVTIVRQDLIDMLFLRPFPGPFYRAKFNKNKFKKWKKKHKNLHENAKSLEDFQYVKII